MISTAIGTVAREYLRVSKGHGRMARSITDQHSDNLAAEQEHGPWTWGEPYRDTGSASKYARKIRDDFDKLSADLKSGEFGAPGTILVLWEISRLSRETGRGVELIDLCEAGDYRIHITSIERTFSPANYADRHSLISGINDSEKEARLLSKRTRRGITSALNAQDDNGNAAARPHGQIPFGYQRRHELVDGRPRPVEQFENPAEAPLVRELFERVLSGEAMYAVSKDWEARGVTSRNGCTFSPQNLRSMLLQPAYAGMRRSKGTNLPGSWDPIIDPEVWHKMQALLADPSRRTYTGAHIQHVLTMTLKCDVCGGPLAVMARRRKGVKTAVGYQCHPSGCVWINKEETDAFLIGDREHPGVILGYLARPDVYGAMAPTTDDGEAEQVRAQLARAQGELKELENATPANLAEARMIGKSLTAKEEEVSALEAKLRGLARPNRLTEIFPPGAAGEDIAARWENTPVTLRRAIVALLLSPEVLGEVRVTRGAQVPVGERITWRTAS